MCHYRKTGAHDKVIFRTMTPSGEPSLENPPFFFGGEQGIIYLADDFGLCSERYKVGSPLQLLEYYHQKDVVVLVTKSVMLAQFSLSAEGKVMKESKLKLSCGPQPERLQGCWAGPGLLATCSHESIVRLWNLTDDESYILSLQGVDERNSLSGDKVTSIDFNPRKQVLACGTRGGRMVLWRCSTISGTPKSENSWQVLPVISASECMIDNLTWGPGENLIHIRTERSSVILNEAQLNTAVHAPYIVVQTAPMQVLLYHIERQTRAQLTTNFRVKGLSVGGTTAMLWNSKQVMLYDIDPQTVTATALSSFKHEGIIVAAVLICQGQDRNIAVATGAKIEYTNSSGHVQKTIPFSPEMEGLPVCLDVTGQFLVASTSMNVIRVWNVSRAQPKPVGTPRKFEAMDQKSLGDIRSVRINKDGTRVSMLVDQRMGPGGTYVSSGTLRLPDSRVFVYDLEADNFITYKVGNNSVPVAHSWDSTDARLMCCEVVPQALAYDGSADKPLVPLSPTASLKGGLQTQTEELEKDQAQHCVLTLFVANAEEILLQDTISCLDPESGMTRMPVALVVPHVYFSRETGDPSSPEGAP
jgi:intraflagellar transport protein 140